jgi:hypothetical protein
MKKSLILLLLPATLVFQSCGGGTAGNGENTDTTKVEEVDYTGMTSFDLNPHGLKTAIMVTEEISSTGSAYPVEVERDTNNFTWNIMSGPGFHVIIEEADGEGNYIEREKERLKNDVVFEEEFKSDEPTMFLYRATLPAGAGQRDYHHVFGVVKINNIDYIIKSDAMGEFSEVQAYDMLKSIKSIAENQKPA